MTDTVRVPFMPTCDLSPDALVRVADGEVVLWSEVLRRLAAASPQGEGDWITHDGGPNPVPGAAEAFDALDLADRLIERAYGGDTPSEWNVAYRGVANARRVTEGVKS